MDVLDEGKLKVLGDELVDRAQAALAAIVKGPVHDEIQTATSGIHDALSSVISGPVHAEIQSAIDGLHTAATAFVTGVLDSLDGWHIAKPGK